MSPSAGAALFSSQIADPHPAAVTVLSYIVLIDQSGVFGYGPDRLLSDSMDLTNIQPTTPRGGHAAGGTPDGPPELGQRGSARAAGAQHDAGDTSRLVPAPKESPPEVERSTYNLLWANS